MSLRDQLQAIYDQHGRLTPELVVEAARPEDHPLHYRVFDRPPKQAAEAWYRHQAHELIRSVRVVYAEATDDQPERSVRAFHAIRSDDEFVYEPVERIAADDLTRQILLRDAEREWRRLFERYGYLQEFFEIVAGDLDKAA